MELLGVTLVLRRYWVEGADRSVQHYQAGDVDVLSDTWRGCQVAHRERLAPPTRWLLLLAALRLRFLRRSGLAPDGNVDRVLPFGSQLHPASEDGVGRVRGPQHGHVRLVFGD
ncbi:MAG TPA: hypothetical protein VMK12_05230 [Anaeromyxobacteraceae bacterium]|nr:hypothetical protein [Anaeromyxobacteraceae bacterium]